MGKNTEDLIYVPDVESLSYWQGPLSLTELENNYELSQTEWDILEKHHLSQRQKECMYLRYWGKATQQEVSTILGISRRSVRKHLQRAKEKITFNFAKSGICVEGFQLKN